MSKNQTPTTSDINTAPNLRREFSGQSVTLHCFDPVSLGVCIFIGLLVLGSASEKKPEAPKPAIDDLVVTRTGAVQEDKVMKSIRGLRRGQVYTYGEELGFTRQVQLGSGSEAGAATSLSFFGLAGQSLEKKFSQSLEVAIGQASTETHQLSVSGDVCPDHDVKVTKVFETAVVSAPKFSQEKIPFRVQVSVNLSAVSLCDKGLPAPQ